MPAPKTLTLELAGKDQRASLSLEAWQGNGLTLECTIADSLTLLAGAVSFVAKIHSTPKPSGTTPLATQTVDAFSSSGSFDFSSAQMSFSIGTADSAFVWLFITALDSAGDELQTLYARRLNILASSWSASVADGDLTVADGVATFSIAGQDYQFAVTTEASATRGSGRISVSSGVASVTLNYFTHTWPVMTA